MHILVTGSNGFVGKNLCVHLEQCSNHHVLKFDLDQPPEALDAALSQTDLVFHLAGVNRPSEVQEFQTGNVGFTAELCDRLMALGRRPKIVFTSSIQAELDNPYGQSKLAAEEVLKRYSEATGAPVTIHRLKNLFGKWCRPNYNSVTATFCYNVSHDLPVQFSNPANIVELTYIDDVMDALMAELNPTTHLPGLRLAEPLASQRITLGELAELIRSFRLQRTSLMLPDFSQPFVRKLYATYLSYLDTGDLAYSLPIKTDNRGCLAEALKSHSFGQIFISRTKPGITRGNHFHHTKTEKFMVVEGEAVVRLRQIKEGPVVEFRIRGQDLRIVDIPPGYTHSIENIGKGELVTLFWASEVFDPGHPDTTPMPI